MIFSLPYSQLPTSYSLLPTPHVPIPYFPTLLLPYSLISYSLLLTPYSPTFLLPTSLLPAYISSLSLPLTAFWAADPKGTMSYRTEGCIFRPSERASERPSGRPLRVQPPPGPSPSALSRPQPPRALETLPRPQPPCSGLQPPLPPRPGPVSP